MGKGLQYFFNFKITLRKIQGPGNLFFEFWGENDDFFKLKHLQHNLVAGFWLIKIESSKRNIKAWKQK